MKAKDKQPPKTLQQIREEARAEWEKKTQGLYFTKDFNSRLEAVMHDPLETVGTRVMAWIILRSWGEYVLYAIRDDGAPAYQRDCVTELGLDKTSVSHAVAYYQKRGYLEDRPKLLYPVISPVLAVPNPKNPKVAEYATFLQNWKVAHSAENQQWELARATNEHFRKLVRAEYKKSRKTKESADATLLETARSLPETGQRAAVSSQGAVPAQFQQTPANPAVDGGMQSDAQDEAPDYPPESPLDASNRRHREAPPKPAVGSVNSMAEARKFLFGEIRRMQDHYPNTPFAKPRIDPNEPGDRGLIDRILTELGAHDEEYLVGYVVHVAAQFKGWAMGGRHKPARAPDRSNGPHSLGLLVHWAMDYARLNGYRRGAGNAK